jgi:small-conductance mechanosensitive channel
MSDLLDPLVVLGQAVLNAELRSGAIAISLSDVLAFILTVCLAFIASSLIRFILEEDVYPPPSSIARLPYIISSLLHYTVLFVGFLLAVSALGVDLNRITILAGAFGVGLGFGLQGLVNNFVSGLIVLFERPIHRRRLNPSWRCDRQGAAYRHTLNDGAYTGGR